MVVVKRGSRGNEKGVVVASTDLFLMLLFRSTRAGVGQSLLGEREKYSSRKKEGELLDYS